MPGRQSDPEHDSDDNKDHNDSRDIKNFKSPESSTQMKESSYGFANNILDTLKIGLPCYIHVGLIPIYSANVLLQYHLPM